MELILGCLSLAVFGLVAAIAESRPDVVSQKFTRRISTSNLRKRFKSRSLTRNRVWDTVDHAKSNSSGVHESRHKH